MRALLYSHLFLSLCAISMIAETAFVFKLWTERTILYVLFVLFSTLVAYNIKGIRAVFGWTDIKVFSEKIRWAKSNKILFLSSYLVSIVLAVLLIVKLPVRSFWILFPMTALAVLYSLPLKVGRYRFSPRNIPFLKTLLVAFVWTTVVAYLPCRMNGIPFQDCSFWLISEFMFLFSLSILFDIKDIKADTAIGIKTFPQQLGVDVTKIISIVLMGSRVIWLALQQPINVYIIFESVVCFIYMIYIVTFINITREEKFYMGWIDGLMLLKCILFLMSNIV
jgi:4-hydroxybenzoate polyprenyltransferase